MHLCQKLFRYADNPKSFDGDDNVDGYNDNDVFCGMVDQWITGSQLEVLHFQYTSSRYYYWKFSSSQI